MRDEPLPELIGHFLIGNIQRGANRPYWGTRAPCPLKKCLRLDSHPMNGTVGVDYAMLDVVPSITCGIMSPPYRSGNHIAVLGMHSTDPSCKRHSFIRLHTADGSHFRRPVDCFVDLVVIEYPNPRNTNSLLQQFFGLKQRFFDALALRHINSRSEQQSTSFEPPQWSYQEMPDPL